MKLEHRNGCGHKWLERACRSVISAVRTMNTIGARNIAARAISSAWLQIVDSIRWRRTSAGTGRGFGTGGPPACADTRTGALTPKEPPRVMHPATRRADQSDGARQRD